MGWDGVRAVHTGAHPYHRDGASDGGSQKEPPLLGCQERQGRVDQGWGCGVAGKSRRARGLWAVAGAAEGTD